MQTTAYASHDCISMSLGRSFYSFLHQSAEIMGQARMLNISSSPFNNILPLQQEVLVVIRATMRMITIATVIVITAPKMCIYTHVTQCVLYSKVLAMTLVYLTQLCMQDTGSSYLCYAQHLDNMYSYS